MKNHFNSLLFSLIFLFNFTQAMANESVGTKKQQVLSDIVTRLTTLEHCEESQNCPEDPSNPRNSFYLLGEQINQQLKLLSQWVDTYGSNEKAITQINHFLQYPNPFVQTQVLTVIKKLPTTPQTFNGLIKILPQLRDSKPLKLILHELTRYPNKQAQIDLLFNDIIAHGSFNAAKVISKNIRPFLNVNNINLYQHLLNKLPTKSAKTTYLRANIKGFLAK